MIRRTLDPIIREKLFTGKAIILMGPRQSGKTTLLRHLISDQTATLWLNADQPDVRALFDDPNSEQLRLAFIGYDIVVVDEAQQLPDIGRKLKLITDELTSIQLIATGSSSFELANAVNEPLTGRKWEYMLYPLSFGELGQYHSLLKERRLLRHRLTYGYYPEVVTSEGSEKEVLRLISESYLYKDILMWQGIKKPDKLIVLLKALAFQIGNQVSYRELAQLCAIDKETVEKYIHALEQAYIIFQLPSFSRNLRNELKRSRKIYFVDLGIRNSVIAAFQEFDLRQDKGVLWENFLISERLKYLNNHRVWTNTYFWRTHAKAEIDWIEEKDGQLNAYEFKWNPKKSPRAPKAFVDAYPNATFNVIHPDNYESFLRPRESE